MRLPRVKFTIRSLIILVFLIAMAFGGTRWMMEMNSLAKWYRSRAVSYWVSEHLYSDPRYGPPIDLERDKLVRHIARLRQKYEYAADHPWLPVEPDPPEPIEATKWSIHIAPDRTDHEEKDLNSHFFHPPRY